LHSGGEIEGSDFLPSDDELQQKRAKKRRKTLRSPEKEKAKIVGRKKRKEAEPKGRKQKHTGIDVDAILKSGSKGNVTNQTVALALRTPEEAEALTTNAGLTMLKEAKKGLRVQAFKELLQIHKNNLHYI
jgi:hypothetical protein